MNNKAASTYRLELFLSVDVAGSTAFKFSNDLADGFAQEGPEHRMGWFSVIEKFYKSFHETFLGKFEALPSDSGVATPCLWKALGDELIYRVTIETSYSVARTVDIFVDAISTSRIMVRGMSKSLDLKASAWIADFPARNAMINLNGLRDSFQDGAFSAEDAARGSDRRELTDFIGPSMDAGFRIGKYASRRKMTLSVELAYILASALAAKRIYTFKFGYDGREDLKGVLGGDGYPVVWLDVEDDQKLREANRREGNLLKHSADLSAEDVRDFCKCFIEASPWMEVPFLKSDGAGEFSNIPASIITYVNARDKRMEDEAPLYNEMASGDAISGSDKNITADDLVEKMRESA